MGTTPGNWAYLYIMKNNKAQQIEKDKLASFQKAASRTAFIEAGGNDGRYKPRVIKDKKKEAKKYGWL